MYKRQAPSTVLVQGYSTDIELVRPTFSYKGLPGIDTPVMAAQPTMRTGFMAQYERDPVILYQFGEELGGDGNGAVVKHRNAMTLGVSYDFTPAVSARFIIPTALHTGSDIPELEADGFALEDMSLGVRFRAFQVGGSPLVHAPISRCQLEPNNRSMVKMGCGRELGSWPCSKQGPFRCCLTPTP